MIGHLVLVDVKCRGGRQDSARVMFVLPNGRITLGKGDHHHWGTTVYLEVTIIFWVGELKLFVLPLSWFSKLVWVVWSGHSKYFSSAFKVNCNHPKAPISGGLQFFPSTLHFLFPQ